jgi:antitoxin (DNA-binding transcriptional repressor) of toxin-antitoxin stability system
MRTVGIKELKDRASNIISEGETVIIEKYGRPVGMYVPLGESSKVDKLRTYQFAENINRLMQEIAQKSGKTAEELADEIELLAENEHRIAH